MPDAALLTAALVCDVVGLGWLALAMEAHWHRAVGPGPLKRSTARVLRVLGSTALALSLAFCLAVDHASMAVLVWVMSLAATALLVALTLTWRPRLLALLAARRPAAA